MTKRIEYDTLVKCVNWEKQKYYLGEATKSLLSGISDNFLLIPDEDYEEAMQALAASRRAEERLFDTARRNNDGMRFENVVILMLQLMFMKKALLLAILPYTLSTG